MHKFPSSYQDIQHPLSELLSGLLLELLTAATIVAVIGSFQLKRKLLTMYSFSFLPANH